MTSSGGYDGRNPGCREVCRGIVLAWLWQKIGVVLLDRLIYHIDDLSIPYQEIEIKVQDTSLPVADHLMVLLLNEFPNALQPTTLTKLQRAFLNKDTMTN